MKQTGWKDIVETAMAGTVCLMMLIYGGAKYWQFPEAQQLQKTLITEMSSMELMWAFYGRSKPFALIIGAIEITGGLLLLPKRTRVLGALSLLLPVLVNIVLQDFFYEVLEGALIAACFYLLWVLIILYFNKEKLIHILGILLAMPSPSVNSVKQRILNAFLIALCMLLLLCIERLFTHFIG